MVREIADWFEILCYTPSQESVETSVRDAAALMNGEMDRVWVGTCAYPPASPTAETLAANVEAVAGLGVRAVSFYNYGIMPKRNLQWVKAAIAGIK